MDSGGHHTQKVYEFAKERLGRRVWAIKGESAQGASAILSGRPNDHHRKAKPVSAQLFLALTQRKT
jgi:phage terminase large subunit GpA-like protein